MNYEQYKQLFNIQHPEYQEKMGKLFELYYPQEKSMSEGQRKSFKEIYDNAELIANALKPLRELGFDFSLSVVGGAVRDTVLDKSETINDYDFVVTLDDSYFSLQALKNKITNSEIGTILNKEEQSSFYRQLTDFEKYLSENQFKRQINDPYLGMSNKKIEEEAKIKLLWQILVERQVKNNLKISNIFRNKDVENKYLNKNIEAIFQVDGLNNKKIDLIVSQHTGRGFAMSFDFEICKGEINLGFMTRHEPFEGDAVKELLNNLWLMPSMLRDIDEKTLSISAGNFDIDHINYFMNKHFLKLKDKFPTHSFNYFFNGLDKQEPMKSKLLDYYTLQDQISVQDNVAKIKKIKI
jgi:hypothetical protein